jgi:hypothetical protein
MLGARKTEMATDTKAASDAATDERHFDVSLKLDHGYEFRADFGYPALPK